ncbi:MAG: radical SAM protein [Planctomycetes bacterium]|nr:radical SAM protein [Planctomycetota bacterium]
MRIGLIAMSGVRVRTRELAELGVTLPGFVRRGEVIASLPSLGLLTVAGLTPEHHELELLELDALPDLGTLPGFDLVGISSLTARIDAAYRVARHYRDRGTPVVLGGLHASALPEEALEHVTSVVVGGAEGTWPRVLEDAENGTLQRIYRGAFDRVFENDLYAKPRFSLLAGRGYDRFTVQTSRGCPRGCAFCAASLRITDRYQQKPVPLVIEELRAARAHFDRPFLELADDNTFLNRAWSRTFLRALAREDIHYFTETDLSIADDPELLDLLQASGCKQVLVGLESPRAIDLHAIDPHDWKRRQLPRMERAIDAIQSRGVSVNGCFILGFDHHTPAIFEEVNAFVRRSGLAEVQLTVLTPFPGTPLHTRLHREGRLLEERAWDRCTLFDVMFQPKGMNVEELEQGMRWLFRETYTSERVRERQRNFIRSRHHPTSADPQRVFPTWRTRITSRG